MKILNLLLMTGFLFIYGSTPVRTEAVPTQNLSRLLTDGLLYTDALRRRKVKNVDAEYMWTQRKNNTF